MKAMMPTYSLVFKIHISPRPNPLSAKRIDRDPDGERNPQSRGKSTYVRISWDEALDIIAKETKKVIREYGLYGILAQMDGHGEMKMAYYAHGCGIRLLN
jgi:nitrate reductase alpha subunit